MSRAERMIESLPVYFWGNGYVERMMRAFAAEFDRLHARIDQVQIGMIPGQSDDSLGFLSMWETMLGLPVRPSGVTLERRQAAIKARFRALDAVTAERVLAIAAEVAGGAVLVDRDAGGAFVDEVTVPAASSSYEGGQAAQIIRRMWPAHRSPSIVFDP